MRYLILIASLITSLSCSSREYIGFIEGKTVAIADGDTLTVLTKSNTQVKIRLSGIDCPERGQDWGTQARKVLSSFVFGKYVKVNVLDKDRYGRYIGTVYLDDANINRAMVMTGSCWVYERYAKDSELFRLHDKAKKERVGLWSMPEDRIIAPWDFRRK